MTEPLRLPFAAIMALVGECGRRTLQAGYIRIPNSYSDEQGNLWTAGWKEGDETREEGIYLSCKVSESKCSTAIDALRRVVSRLTDVCLDIKRFQGIDVSNEAQHRKDIPVDLALRTVVEKDGAAEVVDAGKPEFVPQYTDRVQELLAEKAELERDEQRLMRESQPEIIVYRFPSNPKGIGWLVDGVQ